jgi:general L-amino acid transport system substrate-binding protein
MRSTAAIGAATLVAICRLFRTAFAAQSLPLVTTQPNPFLRLVLVPVLALASCPLAHAGPIVDRIKSTGVIRCGGFPRPGGVDQSPDRRQAAGLYLDLCRAIGAALIGADGRIEFHPYDSDKAFERVESGADDLSFLDGSDIADHRLAGRTALGPVVHFVSTAAMVHGDSAVRRLGDLAGKSNCFYQGANAHRHLEGWMAAHRLSFFRMGYMEYGELYDAYNARVCDAEAGESGDLAAARLDGSAETPSRILHEPLATFSVFAATPASDPQWSAIVAWAIAALQRVELTASPWTASGVDSLGVGGRELGLADDWPKRVVDAAGSYADIYARNLGDRSRLELPRGSNAPAEAGGLFVTPYRE